MSCLIASSAEWGFNYLVHISKLITCVRNVCMPFDRALGNYTHFVTAYFYTFVSLNKLVKNDHIFNGEKK